MGGILHIVPGTDDVANGMVVVARLLAKEQGDAEVVDLKDADCGKVASADEIWVHGMWLPREWMVCRWALKAGKPFVRMTHGSLSPMYLKYQGKWKKRFVGPIERFFLRRAKAVVATCEAEKGWIESYLGRRCPPVEVTDIKRFFNLSRVEGDVEVLTQRSREAEKQSVLGGWGEAPTTSTSATPPLGHSALKNNDQEDSLNILYLGRRHPLKGVEYLESAVRQIQDPSANSASLRLCVKIVSSAFGEEKEQVWSWCDVLVLPTLSDNFGLVIAEALERGKRVITTDGAPAWEGECKVQSLKVEGSKGEECGIWSGYGGRLMYLKGYRDGTPEVRVRLLRDAIERMLGHSC